MRMGSFILNLPWDAFELVGTTVRFLFIDFCPNRFLYDGTGDNGQQQSKKWICSTNFQFERSNFIELRILLNNNRTMIYSGISREREKQNR